MTVGNSKQKWLRRKKIILASARIWPATKPYGVIAIVKLEINHWDPSDEVEYQFKVIQG